MAVRHTSIQPLAAGLPHVAYVLLWFPLFTQPFIFREVECLRQILPLQVYTLYGPNLRNCSQEMKSSGIAVRTYGAKAFIAIMGEMMRAVFQRPRIVWRLFKKNILKKWNSWEVLGENLWAFCVGVKLGKQFQDDGIDIVYAPWPRGASTAARVGAEIAGLPFALAARGDNLEPADPDLEEKFAEALFVRANNRADKKRIETFGKCRAMGKTVLLYNSLTLPGNTERPRRFSQPTLRLLALGRFDVTKGFDVLIQACAILKQKGVKFRLTLAGGGGKVMGLGKLEDSLRKLRHALDLEKEIIMPGLVSHDDLPKILSSHDIFAAPCVIHASGRRDGIPNTVIEAMAYGVPVVSTNVNALPEIVINGKTGITVEPENPDALADAIIYLALNTQSAVKMGENGAHLVGDMFDPGLNARRMAEVFIKSYAAWRKSHIKADASPCAV